MQSLSGCLHNVWKSPGYTKACLNKPGVRRADAQPGTRYSRTQQFRSVHLLAMSWLWNSAASALELATGTPGLSREAMRSSEQGWYHAQLLYRTWSQG